MSYSIKAGDLLPTLKATLIGSNGLAYALTGASSVLFVYSINGGARVTKTASILDSANGRVEYAWASGDTDTPGSCQGEFKVTFPTSKPMTFPSKTFFNFTIAADL